MGKINTAIKYLIIINAILFMAAHFLIPPLQNILALYFPNNEHFGFWQFISHMFMHASFMHILFNMYALWAFGSPLEKMWGKQKFLFFYFSAGLGAAIIYTGVNYFQFDAIYKQLINADVSADAVHHLLTTGRYSTNMLQAVSEEKLIELFQIYNTPVVGASGAIYGVLVAFGMTYPNAKLALIFFPVPIAAKYFIPVLISLDLFSGVTGFTLFSSGSGGGVAHFAHVGGAIIGFILMKYWQKHQFKRWD